MSNIDELIAINNKKSVLLQELKQSLEEENAEFIVVKIPPTHTETRYILFKRETGKEVYYGEKSQIEKFIKRRNIDKVYWRI